MRLPRERLTVRRTAVALFVIGIVISVARWALGTQSGGMTTPLRAPRVDAFAPLAAFALATFSALISFGLARLADDACRSSLTAWAEDGGLTILRCRRCWLIPQVEDRSPTRVVYRLTVVDRGGRRRSGWASVALRFPGGAPAAGGVLTRLASQATSGSPG